VFRRPTMGTIRRGCIGCAAFSGPPDALALM
jgi:hypothetical protein